jgi:hypothetical protein
MAHGTSIIVDSNFHLSQISPSSISMPSGFGATYCRLRAGVLDLTKVCIMVLGYHMALGLSGIIWGRMGC